jgi:hypothetical protein
MDADERIVPLFGEVDEPVARHSDAVDLEE